MVGEDQVSIVSWQPKGECFRKERVVNQRYSFSCVLLRGDRKRHELTMFLGFDNIEVTLGRVVSV